MTGRNLVYVAYSPYENQGKVFDYILEKFDRIYLFSIGHHDLGVGKKTNKLTEYKYGKKINEYELFYIPLPSYLVFSILPWRSLLVFLQVVYHVFKIYKKIGVVDLYFSVNGYAAWMGLVLKKFGLIKITSYWVCDYYPILHTNKIIQFIRWIYWNFEKFSAKSDILTFHNQRLVNIWRKNGAIGNNISYQLAPIGTDKARSYKKEKDLNQISLVFLGVLKRSQGLDFVFDSARDLKKAFPNIQINVLGPGPDTEYFTKRAKDSGLQSKFYGYVSDEDINKVISESTIGLAPYMPDPTSVSYYGDPGKIKRYISFGIPVIATNIHEFSKELQKSQAGVLVTYGKPKELVRAIKLIIQKYPKMSTNAISLNNKYYYRKIYPKMFN